jgi:hypothetical protein
VVLAPTFAGVGHERELYKVYDKQVTWLHEAGRTAMQEIWEREISMEQFAELQAELSERDIRQKALDRQYEQAELEKLFVPAPSREPEAAPPVARAMDEGLEMELDE